MPLDAQDRAYATRFYQSLSFRPLDASKPEERAKYVPLYDDPSLRNLDPVANLATTIGFLQDVGESAMLLSGFRGTGKSTELLRLKRQLEEEQRAVVVYCDMEEYLNPSTPLDISDFLIALAAAFAEGLARDTVLSGSDPMARSFWGRLVDYLNTTEVQLSELGLKADAADLGVTFKAQLKENPTFRRKLQEHLANHLGALVQELRRFVQDALGAVRARHGEVPVVLLLDSIEHLQGSFENAGRVAESLVSTFLDHADKLRFQGLHVVYTVPPWLKIRMPQQQAIYDEVVMLPAVRVQSPDGSVNEDVVALLVKLVERRGDVARLMSTDDLRRLILDTGGALRDLFRVLRVVLRMSVQRGLPATQDVIDDARNEVRSGYLPLSDSDARWLAKVADSGEAHLPDLQHLDDLARFFDNHLVLVYRNGEEWYRVHPLIADEARRIAARSAAEPSAT